MHDNYWSHTNLFIIQQLCKELKEQKELCRKLEEVAGQAEYFASLYHVCITHLIYMNLEMDKWALTCPFLLGSSGIARTQDLGEHLE